MTQLYRCYTNYILRYLLCWIVFTMQSYYKFSWSYSHCKSKPALIWSSADLAPVKWSNTNGKISGSVLSGLGSSGAILTPSKLGVQTGLYLLGNGVSFRPGLILICWELVEKADIGIDRSTRLVVRDFNSDPLVIFITYEYYEKEPIRTRLSRMIFDRLTIVG